MPAPLLLVAAAGSGGAAAGGAAAAGGLAAASGGAAAAGGGTAATALSTAAPTTIGKTAVSQSITPQMSSQVMGKTPALNAQSMQPSMSNLSKGGEIGGESPMDKVNQVQSQSKESESDLAQKVDNFFAKIFDEPQEAMPKLKEGSSYDAAPEQSFDNKMKMNSAPKP